MLQLIDRRSNSRGKSLVNRARFLRRYTTQIREAVKKMIGERHLADMQTGGEVRVPKKDISEPSFGFGRGGDHEIVLPGNRKYAVGDRIPRPTGAAGTGDGTESGDGDGEDAFVFSLSREEFMQIFFDDLELPRLVKTQLLAVPTWKNVRAGFSAEGTPNNIDVVRSLRSALGRRIALGSPLSRQLHEMERQLEVLQEENGDAEEIARLEADIVIMKGRITRIPFIDPFDLRYVNRIKQPTPSSKAVMFCLMDVSGSMDEQRKDLSKRFFILLYLFLNRNYEKIEVVFIRHHTRAEEVDEETFFHSTESGGTVVSSALELMKKIMDERYSPAEWNIYGAQASDGDNWTDDSPKCRKLLAEDILPKVRYFAYIQVAPEEQNLWVEYAHLAQNAPELAMKKVESAADIYPVFRELFEKQQAAA